MITICLIVAGLVAADRLIILTDIDGLYDSNPRTNPNAKKLDIIEKINAEIFWCKTGSNRGTGAIITKLQAADYATKRGVERLSVINGSNPENLYEVIDANKMEQNFYLLNNRRKIMTTLEQMGAKAKDASRFLMTAGSKKDIALDALDVSAKKFLRLTKLYLRTGKKRSYGITSRQTQIIGGENDGMADGVRQVAALPDPVGRVLDAHPQKRLAD